MVPACQQALKAGQVVRTGNLYVAQDVDRLFFDPVRPRCHTLKRFIMMDDRIATRCGPDVEFHAQAMLRRCIKRSMRVLRRLVTCPQAAMRVEIISQDEAFRHLVCDFEYAVDFDCHTQRQFGAGYCRPRMAARVSEYIHHQV